MNVEKIFIRIMLILMALFMLMIAYASYQIGMIR